MRCGEQDEIGGLTAGLEAEAGSGELDEGRCAPSMAGAAGDDALAVLSADDEGSLFEAGDDGDAGGAGGDVFWDALVRGVHDFVENELGCLNPFVEFLGIGGGCGDRQGCSDAKCVNKFLHHLCLLSCRNGALIYGRCSAMLMGR